MEQQSTPMPTWRIYGSRGGKPESIQLSAKDENEAIRKASFHRVKGRFLIPKRVERLIEEATNKTQ